MADTIANWVSAITTTMALGAALWAGLAAWKLHGIEVDREEARHLADKQRQAELVATWVSWTDQPAVAICLPNGRTARSNLAMQNGSAVPIYNVDVTYSVDSGELGTQKFSMLSPTGSSPHHRQIKCRGVENLLAKPRDPDARVDIRMTLSFTDAGGNRWTRDAAGLLSEVSQ